ncbi:MAG: substrate-binding domain-containing protein [Patescibacteria group bacterium]
MKKIIIVFALLVAVIVLAWWLNAMLAPKAPEIMEKEPLVIGFSLGTTREERWFSDRDLFIKRAEELGAAVSVALSDYNVPLQISQIQNLISQGVKVIVVIPSDSEKIAPIIEEAHQAGVRIIAYDRLIKDANVDLYLSFDNVKVGQLEAQSILDLKSEGDFAYIGGAPTDNNAFLLRTGSMSVLDPKIRSGEINLVVNQLMEGWKPDEAYKTIKNYLATGQTLDAVIAANDGTAFGAIQALKEKGLAGIVPVSGQDAELSACQRIVDGTQASTVYKPIKLLAYRAAEIAVAMASGQEPEVNSTIDNGKVQVLSYFLEPILVTKENMLSTIIKDGFHTYEEVYRSQPPIEYAE